MTPEQEKAIRALREEGYCVVIWTPDELGESNSSHLEEVVIERGNIFLESEKRNGS